MTVRAFVDGSEVDPSTPLMLRHDGRYHHLVLTTDPDPLFDPWGSPTDSAPPTIVHWAWLTSAWAIALAVVAPAFLAVLLALWVRRARKP